jgi:hypothetical protein
VAGAVKNKTNGPSQQSGKRQDEKKWPVSPQDYFRFKSTQIWFNRL